MQPRARGPQACIRPRVTRSGGGRPHASWTSHLSILRRLPGPGHVSQYCYRIHLQPSQKSGFSFLFFTFLDRDSLKLEFLAPKSICGGLCSPHRILNLVRRGDLWGSFQAADGGRRWSPRSPPGHGERLT